MSFALGLTGSIGMGKSFVAGLFAEEGSQVWDADAAVRRLYSRDGAAVGPIGLIVPNAVQRGQVRRSRLREAIAANPSILSQIEEIVHPLVWTDREAFRVNATAGILVFDIPLLFETGGAEEMDAVAVVSVAPDLQRKRIQARGTMNADQVSCILERQLPDVEKRARADYVIVSDTPTHARAQVRAVLDDIRERQRNA